MNKYGKRWSFVVGKVIESMEKYGKMWSFVVGMVMGKEMECP